MDPIRIHASKTPIRHHYIAEWAEKYGRKKADIARATGADKSLVGKWFAGTMPSDSYLAQIAASLDLEDPMLLLRHPDEDWLYRFYKQRSQEELERAERIIREAFPDKKTG